ncbi:hypothetical protein [Streptomyces guryensis]|uniref:Penicillinase repressor n=1 Tax=Streptomyces guryensis TaxID=2886947 RepID=A0A9Q3Z5K1_9ACTN|nr:hypothetical protein [Streptomyces guryensis]MCD9874978.1 hypothetical protein [Streptomyces guryensis]
MSSRSTASLRARYVEQAVSDLAENRRRQNELAEKAKMLKQEEALLMDILKLAERYEETNPSPEPPPRHQPPSRPEQLRELLVELLGTHDQPRSARVLRDELVQRHPDRAPTPQVVRNALESLVAKGRIRRHKQERAVSYSLSGSGRAVR